MPHVTQPAGRESSPAGAVYDSHSCPFPAARCYDDNGLRSDARSVGVDN